jgi:hypothetical protein
MSKKDNGVKAKAPDREVCTTLDLGLEGFVECPRVGPNDCEFALPFGYGYLCRETSSHRLRPRGPRVTETQTKAH